MKQVFQWVAAAKRPMSLDELREAISIEPGQSCLKPERFINDMTQIIPWCCHMLFLDEEEDTIQFSHHSIKQFLVDHSHTGDYYSLCPRAINSFAGTICVTYLGFNELRQQLQKRDGFKFQFDPMTALDVSMSSSSSNGLYKAWSTLGKHRDCQPANNINIEDYLGSIYLSEDRSYPGGRARKYSFLDYARDYWLLHSVDFFEMGKKSSCCSYETVDPSTWHLWKDFLITDHFLARKPWTAKEWFKGSRIVLHWIANHKHLPLLRLWIASKLDSASLSDLVREILQVEPFLGTMLPELCLLKNGSTHDMQSLFILLRDAVEIGGLSTVEKNL